eukprot:270146_1
MHKSTRTYEGLSKEEEEETLSLTAKTANNTNNDHITTGTEQPTCRDKYNALWLSCVCIIFAGIMLGVGVSMLSENVNILESIGNHDNITDEECFIIDTMSKSCTYSKSGHK